MLTLCLKDKSNTTSTLKVYIDNVMKEGKTQFIVAQILNECWKNRA